MRTVLMTLAALAALAVAGSANAVTYILDQDACSSTCIASPATDAGKVVVTSITGGINISIQLADGIFFNQAGGGHDSFGFDLLTNPGVTLSNFVEVAVDATNPTGDFGTIGGPPSHTVTHPPLSESGGGKYNAHQFSSGAAGWGYGFDWVGATKNNGSLSTKGIKTLSFDVTGTGVTLDSLGTSGTPAIFFTVDVARLVKQPDGTYKTAATGVIGASTKKVELPPPPPPGVPEPAAWALMILGFGGAGAMLRRSRALATAA